MRKWFGADAGKPGTNFRIVFSGDKGGYQLRPLNALNAGQGGQLWKAYMREQIPGLFNFEFSTGSWNQGFITKPGHIFLLVTLEKADMAEDHRYQDNFESSDIFAWQSQNRTTRSSGHGQLIKNHNDEKVTVYLFVRKTKKLGQRAAPFIYCGEVDFVSWEGEQPISVTWRLRNPLPDHTYRAMK
jgi:hypothetical protein